jgi:putative ABC transport system substrate-binding protein
MDRRTFIAWAGSAAAAWPRAAIAQQTGGVRRVGLVMGVNTPVYVVARAAFLDEMGKSGFVEGRNFVLDVRSNQQGASRLAADMAELVAWKADVIIAGGTLATLRAAQSAGPNVPIVMWANNYDPIATGFVRSLARPGGNVTGVFTRQPELTAKQVELLKETFPRRNRLAVLWDSQSTGQFEGAIRQARTLGIEANAHKLEKMPYDIPAAFHAMMAKAPEMLLVCSGPNIGTYQQVVVDQALQLRLPSMYIFRTYVARGGLMSYGVDIGANFRRVAALVAKVLNGTQPAILPIEQPTTYELAVNLKTAKAIGIELPTSILLRANEVIE